MNIMNMLNPQNLGQMKSLFQSYGHFLSPENKSLVAGIISEMEKGDGQMDQAKINAAVSQISRQVKSSGVSAADLQKMNANDWQRAQQQAYGNKKDDHGSYNDDNYDRNYGGYDGYEDGCNDYDDEYDDYDDGDEEYISDNDYF